jgi:hypothetical protein
MADSLNDRVDAIYGVLIEDDRYRALIGARSNAESVEGSLSDDTIVAANMVRNHAKKTADTAVAGQKLHTIVKALNVVKRRYGHGSASRPRRIAR